MRHDELASDDLIEVVSFQGTWRFFAGMVAEWI